MPKKKLPNIILIVLDTARAKNFSCYSYHRPTTPNIDRIAEEGVLYKWCFSPAPWTSPSHASLFTGLYPSQHGVDGDNFSLPESVLTIAEVLSQMGYITCGISSNGLVSKLLGFARGYAEWHETYHIIDDGLALTGSKMQKIRQLVDLLRKGEILPVGQRLVNVAHKRIFGDVIRNATPATYRSVRSLLRKVHQYISGGKQPFFIFLNLMQTHDHYNPPRGFRGRFGPKNLPKYRHLVHSQYQHYALKPLDPYAFDVLTTLYDEELAFADHMVGYIDCALKSLGIADETIFIITSDHGELLGEHGHYHHLFTLHNELIHVPLVIRYPRDFGIRGQDERLVQTLDLFPTILEAIDCPFPAPAASFSLLGRGKRRWAAAQLLDVGFKLRAMQELNPSFDASSFPFNCSESRG